MACLNCDKCHWNIRHKCRVCELVDKDNSVKPVCWCNECKAYICKACWPDLIKRAKAFVKDKLETTIEIIEEFIEKKKRKKKDAAPETST